MKYSYVGVLTSYAIITYISCIVIQTSRIVLKMKMMLWRIDAMFDAESTESEIKNK